MKKFRKSDLDITMQFYLMHTLMDIPLEFVGFLANVYCDKILSEKGALSVINDVKEKRYLKYMIHWLHDYGFNQVTIAKLLGIMQPSVSYHLKKELKKPYYNFTLRRIVFYNDKTYDHDENHREYLRQNNMYVKRQTIREFNKVLQGNEYYE